jgi:hypothetical protein
MTASSLTGWDVAAAGPTHSHFSAEKPMTYLSIVWL